MTGSGRGIGRRRRAWLYGSWDDQFYPNRVGAWFAKIDTGPSAGGGLRIDEKSFSHGDDFRGLRVHQVRLQNMIADQLDNAKDRSAAPGQPRGHQPRSTDVLFPRLAR